MKTARHVVTNKFVTTKNLKRATIVGETTGGGAHPGGPSRINAHFDVWVPRGRAINPISKTNWEAWASSPT